MNSQMWTGEKVRLSMDNPDVMADALCSLVTRLRIFPPARFQPRSTVVSEKV